MLRPSLSNIVVFPASMRGNILASEFLPASYEIASINDVQNFVKMVDTLKGDAI